MSYTLLRDRAASDAWHFSSVREEDSTVAKHPELQIPCRMEKQGNHGKTRPSEQTGTPERQGRCSVIGLDGVLSLNPFAVTAGLSGVS
jgi:hypothetical protein